MIIPVLAQVGCDEAEEPWGAAETENICSSSGEIGHSLAYGRGVSEQWGHNTPSVTKTIITNVSMLWSSSDMQM